MIPKAIIESLIAALDDVRNASDNSGGWLSIISLFENAIEKANNNKYFSVKDASRIYLEFNSDYTSTVFTKIDNVSCSSEKFFIGILEEYITRNYDAKNVERHIKELTRYDDILEEFVNYILNDQKFIEPPLAVVEGYSAKQLCSETILSPLGAFNYLVYLKEEPNEALADLKAKLPRRKLYTEDEKKEVQATMDEKITTPVEEVAEPQQAPAETPAEQKVLLEKLEAVQQALAGLQQSFDDKIAEDAHKNGLFDNMHRELTRYQNGALDKIVDTIALDIIQLVDTTKGHVRVYDKKEPTEDNYKRLLRIVKGIAEDLEDILYRQSIESYRVEGHEVDVRRQKIIQTIPTDDKSKDNLVAVRAADGYEKDGKVLRPERIKIFKYEATSATETNDN